MAEYDGAGNMLKRYVHGPNPDADDPLIEYTGTGTAAADRRNLYADARGSVVLYTDSSGTTLHRNTYDEYGVPSTSNGGRFQYTGQIWLEELGMNYYKARIYSPRLGRFMQTDPIGYEDNVNLYAYVANDPVNAVDPTGLAKCAASANCEQFERARQALIRARDQFSSDSDEHQRIDASLENIGEPGQGNMLIQGEAAFKNADGTINTSIAATMQDGVMTIYSEAVALHGSFGMTEGEYLAGIIAHEADGDHMAAPRDTKEQFINAEISGYRTGDAARRGVDRAAGRVDRGAMSEEALRGNAEGSLAGACGNTPDHEICQ